MLLSFALFSYTPPQAPERRQLSCTPSRGLHGQNCAARAFSRSSTVMVVALFLQLLSNSLQSYSVL